MAAVHPASHLPSLLSVCGELGMAVEGVWIVGAPDLDGAGAEGRAGASLGAWLEKDGEEGRRAALVCVRGEAASRLMGRMVNLVTKAGGAGGSVAPAIWSSEWGGEGGEGG